VSDVQNWLAHSLSSVFGISQLDEKPITHAGICASVQNFWNVDGRTLSSLSEEEFRRRDAVYGDRLYASLELWKMLQWKDVPSAVSQGNALSSPGDFELANLMLEGSPCPSLDASSSIGSPAELPGGPSSMGDMKLLTEPCIPETFSASRFSNPSSVDASSKNSDGNYK